MIEVANKLFLSKVKLIKKLNQLEKELLIIKKQEYNNSYFKNSEQGSELNLSGISYLSSIIPGGLIFINKKGSIIHINEAAVEIIKNIDPKIKNENLIKNIHFIENTVIKVDIQKCIEKGEIIRNKKVIISNNSHNIFILYSIAPAYFADKDVNFVLLTLQDDSKELVKQEELIRILTALDNTGVAIITTDHNYNLSYVNKSAVNLWGYSNNGDMIQNHTIYDLLDEESVTKFLGKWNKIVSDRVYFFSDEMVAKKQNGTNFPIEIKATLITDTNERPVGISMSVNDISEQISIRDELVRAKEMAEESDHLKSAFLANMSHEIRTPMNGILGFAYLLKKPNLKDEIRDKYINLINSNGELLVKIIDDIIDLAKIEARQLKIVEHDCNVQNLLNELHIFFNKHLEKINKTNISLFLSIPENENIIISTDTLRLKQILMNLIENALKFTNEGRIEFGYKIESSGHILFFVSDTGIGIPYEKQQIIFERFLQLDYSPAREYGGTGLGLSISKSLVEMMNGKIWVESKPGEGSSFKFILPVKHTSVSKQLINLDEEMDITEYHWGDKTILIAEDEENNYYLLEEFLHDTHVKVLWAKEGRECLNLFINNNVDLVLLDIKIPNLSGYEVMKEIKKIKASIPVIAQTAYALTGDKEKMLKAGFDDYIAKPINLSAILTVINKYFKK